MEFFWGGSGSECFPAAAETAKPVLDAQSGRTSKTNGKAD